MSKACPYCTYSLTKSDFRDYLKRQSGDLINCPQCDESFYIVVPEKSRLKMYFMNFLAVIPVLLLSFGSVLTFFLYGERLFDENTSRYDVRVVALIGFGLFLGLCIVAALAFRAIQWKFSVAQKSPFV